MLKVPPLGVKCGDQGSCFVHCFCCPNESEPVVICGMLQLLETLPSMRTAQHGRYHWTERNAADGTEARCMQRRL